MTKIHETRSVPFISFFTSLAVILAACSPAASPAPIHPPESNPPGEAAPAASEEPAASEVMLTPAPFILSSPAFENEGVIPNRFSCLAENLSPELNWSGPPLGTQSLALLFDDPDAPGGSWVHWIVYNLPPEAGGLPEGVTPDQEMPDGGAQGANSWGRSDYGGPCPPASSTHRYVFILYALERSLTFDYPPNKQALLEAMDGHILSSSTLAGAFSR